MANEIPRFVKIAVAAGGAAVALSGAPALLSNQENNHANTNPGTHTEWVFGPCPKDFVAPWDPKPTNKQPGAINGEIKLVSIKRPEPTPDRYPIECMIPVQVPNSQTENTNPAPDTTQQS